MLWSHKRRKRQLDLLKWEITRFGRISNQGLRKTLIMTANNLQNSLPQRRINTEGTGRRKTFTKSSQKFRKLLNKVEPKEIGE